MTPNNFAYHHKVPLRDCIPLQSMTGLVFFSTDPPMMKGSVCRFRLSPWAHVNKRLKSLLTRGYSRVCSYCSQLSFLNAETVQVVLRSTLRAHGLCVCVRTCARACVCV